MLTWLEPLLFGATVLLAFLSFRSLGRSAHDGWTFPPTEERWLKGGLVSFLILSREASLAAFLPYWGEPLHRSAALVSLLVASYAVHGLLHGARFHDRLSPDRGNPRPSGRLPYRAAGFSFLAACAVFLYVKPFRAEYAFLALAPSLLWSALQTFHRSEWKRIRKRSARAPLYFYYSLLAFAAGAIILPLWGLAGGSFQLSSFVLAATMLLACLLRDRAAAYRVRRARNLVEECRRELSRASAADARLRALCAFVESEWSAVRVTLLSVKDGMGLVIASDGADALALDESTSPRRLGPFLKRTCREGHMLYAPVAEELAHEFQAHGLRHSSLAIPFRQEGQVRALLCLMAEEGERIGPGDALVLEIFSRDLGLEILSATAQFVAEERAAKLLALARQSDSIAVEHMDSWGHFQPPQMGEVRFLVGAQLIASPTVARHRSPLLARLHAAQAREMRALWRCLGQAFEFMPREQQGILWMVSPRDFQSPFLRAMGPERCSLLLCYLLAKAGRQLAEKEAYLLLAGNQPRLVAGPAEVKSDGAAPGGIELDHSIRENLSKLLAGGEPGVNRWAGRAPRELNDANFRARAGARDRMEGQDFYSLLNITADKKEIRRLEQKAVEAARDFLRKAA